ncbi:hypothetical protein [Actinocrispum sp. NPDC049592]|uniref:hypothetical protein n=1 Tax=Actinocrispum sp. NPDC049592 TaxID=3154835 RepID=UPI00342E1FE0
MIRALRKVFDDDPQDIIGSTGAGRFVVLGKEKKVLQLGFGPDCVAGIGAVAASVASLRDSYQDASTALCMAARLPGIGRVVHIDDVRVQELVASSAEHTRAQFVRGLLSSLSDQAGWPVPRPP